MYGHSSYAGRTASILGKSLSSLSGRSSEVFFPLPRVRGSQPPALSVTRSAEVLFFIFAFACSSFDFLLSLFRVLYAPLMYFSILLDILQRRVAFFARTYFDHILHIVYKDLSVADVPCIKNALGCLNYL